MNNFSLFVFLIAITNIACGQIMRGRVLDKDSNKAIDYAVIYFNGTFVGTNTDRDGYFELDISKNRSMPLTISALGYYSMNIEGLSGGKTLVVYLTPKTFELYEAVVTGVDKRGIREKNLNLFRKQFIGTSVNARNCKIINENDIGLSYENDILKAFTSEPIQIDNKSLGYRVTYYLDKFEYNKKEGITEARGNILFKEDLTDKRSQKRHYERVRERTYLGSKMQFFRALWDNKLDSAGFEIVNWKNERLHCDSLITSDSVKIRNNKCLSYSGKLYVTYLSDVADSYIEMLKDSVYFDRDGANVDGARWYGKMSKQRMADCLPFEFTLSNQK